MKDIREDIQNIDDHYIKRLADFMYKNFSFYPIGYSVGILKEAKNEMDAANVINSDNYYHRLGMALLGQESEMVPAIRPWAEILGYSKEVYDVWKKTRQGKPLAKTLLDSIKDLKNNYEALDWGLTHPQENSRIWLKDLDINSNTWRK